MKRIRPIRSAVKLTWIVICETFLACRALMSVDVRTAKDHLRRAVTSVHDDLVQLIVGLQRLILGSHRVPATLNRILIVKLDRVGDMINTTPVLNALRKRFPGARVDVVGHPLCLSLFEGDDRVGESIAYKSWLYHDLPVRPPGPRACWVVMKLLIRRYPLVVYLRGSIPFLFLGLTSRLTASKFIEGEPVIDRHLKPLEELLGPIQERQPSLHVQPEAAVLRRSLLFSEQTRRGPSIVIHPTSCASTRTWPAERFSELADRLVSVLNAQIHFLGSPADRAVLDMIAGRALTAHAYHWSLKLTEVVALIAQSDLLIGNDSGLAHVAAAVGTRMVVVWGAANLGMSRPKAPPEQSLILYHDLPCRAACIETVCSNPIHLECLRRTEVDDLLDAARRLLGPSARETPAAMPFGASVTTPGLAVANHP